MPVGGWIPYQGVARVAVPVSTTCGCTLHNPSGSGVYVKVLGYNLSVPTGAAGAANQSVKFGVQRPRAITPDAEAVQPAIDSIDPDSTSKLGAQNDTSADDTLDALLGINGARISKNEFVDLRDSPVILLEGQAAVWLASVGPFDVTVFWREWALGG